MNRFFAALAALLLAAIPCLTQAQTVVSVNVGENRHPINPLIYGAAFPTTAQAQDLNITVSRFGGNEASSYNWLQNCAAKGNDWYFETYPNDSSSVAGEAVDSFVSSVKAGGASPILTMPVLTYVGSLGPNRSVVWSYSIAKYGPQQGSDPYNSDAGNGVSSATGLPILTNNPLDANTPNSLSMQQSWLSHLISTFGTSSTGGVKYYVIDNEPSIWYSTHQDVHPVGESYNELYQDYVDYAGAIRTADPGAVIIGPEEFGWTGYFYSGLDMQWGSAHNWQGPFPDKSSHNGMDHIPWLLQALKQYQTSTGIQLLNVLSCHYYPQQGEFSDDDSAGMQAIRNRSTRSLWDPNYVDTSWIGSVVQMIPRMKGWVNSYYPGLQTAITEYNWGDEGAMNGATTQADIFGIFGREGLDMSSRWTTPATNSPTYLAMKMYRNYNGLKGAFGDTSVECIAPDPDDLSAFAAQRTSDGALTVMLINKLTSPASVQVNVAGYTSSSTAAAWQISPTSMSSITQIGNVSVGSTGFSVNLPAQSVTLYVLRQPSNGVTALTLTPSSVTGGASSVGLVTLGTAAPKGGTAVKLLSSDPSLVDVPASVTVKQGQTTASFKATTKVALQDYSSTITATAASESQNATLSVYDDSVSGLTLSPNPVLGGTTVTGTLTLDGPAPPGGWVVNLKSGSSKVGVPKTVTVLAGATTATFPVTTTASTQTYTCKITASDSRSISGALLTVQDDSVSSVKFTPTSTIGGSSATCVITLAGPAPSGGWVVNLSSSNSSVVTVPSTATVPAGAKSVSVAVATSTVTKSTSVTVTASDALSKKSGSLTVRP